MQARTRRSYGKKELGPTDAHYTSMDLAPRLLLLALGVMLLVGAMFAINAAITEESKARPFADQDADGEPDETPDEKRRGLDEES